jgi:hypothetical protein
MNCAPSDPAPRLINREFRSILTRPPRDAIAPIGNPKRSIATDSSGGDLAGKHLVRGAPSMSQSAAD